MGHYFLKEFYQTSQHVAALILTPERRALQAWRVDTATGKMERMDTLIMDILNNHVRPLSEESFQQYCHDNAINPAIPEQGIQLSFRLSAYSAAKKSNTVPAPSLYCRLAL